MIILIIIVTIILIYFIVKPYFIHYDTIIAFTGGLGSGKSLLSVEFAIKLYRKNYKKVWIYNHLIRHIKKIFKPKNKYDEKEYPKLYSSIPLTFKKSILSKREFSYELTESHLLLIDRINNYSVVFIDEIGSFANQFEYKNPNILDNFNEFIRLFRHYTKGGYLVINDQCSENIVLEVRRRINVVYNLMHFRKWLGIIYSVKIRNINISEEIKTIEENNSEDNMKTKIGILPSKNTYDTYCYSERYRNVYEEYKERYNKLKKNKLLVVSKSKKDKKTSE